MGSLIVTLSCGTYLFTGYGIGLGEAAIIEKASLVGLAATGVELGAIGFGIGAGMRTAKVKNSWHM